MLNRLFSPAESRAITFQKLFEAGDPLPAGTVAGVNVSQQSAYAIAPVFAAIRLIADTISTLPLDTFQRVDGSRVPFRPKPVWVDQPDPDPSHQRADHYQALIVSLLVSGESFTRILRVRGEVVGLSILDPTRVQVRRNRDGRIEFAIDRGARVLPESEIVHITDLRKPGALHGTSRVDTLKETLGLAKALELFSASFFGSGSTTSGVIEVPGEMTAEQAASLQEAWEAGHRGLRRAHRPGILSAGATYKPTSVNPEQSQLLEAREFAVEEICRVFRIPPHLLQSTKPGAMSYASVEESNKAFLQYTILPILGKIEAAYSTLLPSTAFLKFNVDGFLRATLQDRYAAYSQAIQAGFLSINEIHRLEDLRPVDGGDVYRVPLSHVDLAAANLVELSRRVDAATRLINVGFDPSQVCAAVGLPEIEHTGVPSVQLQGIVGIEEYEAAAGQSPDTGESDIYSLGS